MTRLGPLDSYKDPWGNWFRAWASVPEFRSLASGPRPSMDTSLTQICRSSCITHGDSGVYGDCSRDIISIPESRGAKYGPQYTRQFFFYRYVSKENLNC